MLSSTEEVVHSNPVAPAAVPVETTTVVKKLSMLMLFPRIIINSFK